MVFVTTESLLLLVSVLMPSQWEYNRHKHKDKENKRVIICICLCLSWNRGCSQNACFAGQDTRVTWLLTSVHTPRITHISGGPCIMWTRFCRNRTTSPVHPAISSWNDKWFALSKTQQTVRLCGSLSVAKRWPLKVRWKTHVFLASSACKLMLGVRRFWIQNL